VSRVVVRAHAKINLCLRLLGKRQDGYHELQTIVQSIDLHDTLSFEPGGRGFRLQVEGDADLPAGEDNLVCRAARRILGDPRSAGVRARLVKRIPTGAGLGGGSSDAAATLLGLDRLLRLGLPEARLLEDATALGSDVPFFLAGGTALLRGRGTEVEPIPEGPPASVVILSPGVPLSTAAVYAQVQEPLTLAPKIDSMPGFGRIPVDLKSWVRAGNDLEPHATRLCAVIPAMKGVLLANGATAAAMSGSGSAVFGIFDDPEVADRAAREAVLRGYRAWTTRTLPRRAVAEERFEAGSPPA
jgi:4-diphosphocytidyl-2-C-methyl-D-erythritol kinase